MEWKVVVGVVVVAIVALFNIAATVAVTRSTLLDPFQKWAQAIFVWVVPVFGAFVVVHLVSDNEPEVVTRRALAWSGVGWCLLFAASREFGSEGMSGGDGGAGFSDLGGGGVGGDGGGAGGGP